MRIKINEEEYNILIKALSLAIAENDPGYVEYYLMRDKIEKAKRYSESNTTPRGVIKH